MKNFSIFLFLIVLSATCLSANSRTNTLQGDPQILVTIMRSEHSRDSNSVTTTLTVSGNSLIYSQVRSGAHSRGSKPIERRFELSNEDRRELARLLNERKLLVTKTISKSAAVTGQYLSLSFSIHSNLSGKEGLISINGPMKSTAIKNDPLYQNSLVLINELYRVVHRTEPLLGFQEFVDDTGDE